MRPRPLCTVELLCVGNELLIGKTLNTNARWLASQIAKLGGRVSKETTVEDNLQGIASSLREALRRKPDMIITTGGLGPTHDDMTLRGLAKAIHRPVQLNRTAIEFMKVHYRRIAPGETIHLNRPRLKMARLPLWSKPVVNPVGSAPAVLTEKGRTKIICLPGVPKEMRAIFKSSIAPMIRARTGEASYYDKSIMVQGIVESELSPIIDRAMNRYPNVFIKSHPRGGRGLKRSKLELHFSATSSDERETREEILKAVRTVVKPLASRKGVHVS